MKKLLSFIGTVGIIAGFGASVVACFNPKNEENLVQDPYKFTKPTTVEGWKKLQDESDEKSNSLKEQLFEKIIPKDKWNESLIVTKENFESYFNDELFHIITGYDVVSSYANIYISILENHKESAEYGLSYFKTMLDDGEITFGDNDEIVITYSHSQQNKSMLEKYCNEIEPLINELTYPKEEDDVYDLFPKPANLEQLMEKEQELSDSVRSYENEIFDEVFERDWEEAENPTPEQRQAVQDHWLTQRYIASIIVSDYWEGMKAIFERDKETVDIVLEKMREHKKEINFYGDETDIKLKGSDYNLSKIDEFILDLKIELESI